MMKPSYDFTVDTIIEQGKVRKSDVEKVKSWLRGEADVPNLTEEQIVVFLLSCNNDQSSTRATIKAHYGFKRNLPELFDDRSVDLDKDVKYLLSRGYYVIFPVRTPDGCVIAYNGVKKPVSGRYTAASLKIWSMFFEVICKEGPPTGLILLTDMKNLGFMNLASVRVGYLRSFIHYLQEGLPLKLRKIYVLNVSSLMSILNALMKPFMKEEVYNMMSFVPAEKVEETVTKEIPRECLPSDYGGLLPNIENLHQKTTEKLRELKGFFDAEQKQRHEVCGNKNKS